MAGLLANIVGSLMGGIFGGSTPAQQTQNFNSSGTTTGSQYGSQNFSSAPTLDSQQLGLRNNLIQAAMQQLTGALPDTNRIQSQMLQNTNTGYDAAQQALRQTLASRGLTYSPMAGSAESGLNTQRIGAGIGVMNQMPLLREQLLQQRLNNALNIFRSQPFGQSGTSTSVGNTTGTTSQSGSSTGTQQNSGGLFGGLGAGLVGAAPSLGDFFKGMFPGGGYHVDPGVSGSVGAGGVVYPQPAPKNDLGGFY